MLNVLGLFVKQAYAQGQTYAPCNAGEGDIQLGDCLLLNDGKPISEVYSDPAFLVNLIVRNLFVLAGIILFLLIIFAGYKFVLGGKKGADEAKTIATNAVIGFVLMFAAYWLVQLIALVTGVEIPL